MLKKLLPFIIFLSVTNTYGQSVYKKGYLVNLENDTIRGFVLVTEQQKYYSEFTFKSNKREKAKTYTPTEIKAYGYGYSNKGNIHFEAHETPLTEKNLMLEDSSKRTFLKIFAASELYIFYTSYYNRQKSYYLKTPENDLIPIVLGKSNAEKYKVSSGVYQINGETFTVSEGTKITSSDNKVFLFEKGVLNEIVPIYQNELRKIAVANNCDLEERIKNMKLSQNALSNYSADLHECLNISHKFSNRAFFPQISILAFGSTRPYTRKIHYGYEKGILLELRESSISPNMSLSLGYSQTDYTNELRTIKVPTLTGEKEKYKKVLYQTQGSSVLIKINYHFFNGHNLRPYVSFNSKMFSQISRMEDYFNPISGSLPISIKDRSRVTYTALGGAIGLDWYFLKYLQMRGEVGYTNGVFEYQLGFGVVIQ